MKNYYEILGVSESASQDDIKKRYRSLALEMHPDRLVGKQKKEVEEIEKKFQEITNAYQTLSDEKERKKYDEQRRFGSNFGGGDYSSGFDGSSNWEGFEDIFESFFGGGRNRRSSSRSSNYYQSSQSYFEKADSLEMLVTASFKDFVFGFEHEFEPNLLRSCLQCSQTGAFSNEHIKKCASCNGKGFVEIVRETFLGSFRTKSVCSSCSGSGKIITKKCSYCHGSKLKKESVKVKFRVPRGLKPGQKITVKSKGNDQIGKLRGDIIFNIELEKNDNFSRKGNDIHSSVPISFLDAILGNKIKVLTIEGIEEVTVPKFSQVGDFFILKNKGFYTELNGNKRGDLHVWFNIKLPKKIASKTEELIKEINNNSSWSPNEDFIKKIKSS